MDDKVKPKRSLLGPGPARLKLPVTGTAAVRVYNRSSNSKARDAGATQNDKQNNRRRPKKRRGRLNELENAEFIKELEEVHFIIKIDHKTKSEEKLGAQFYCEICKVTLETQQNAATHARSKQHRKESKKKAASMAILCLPQLSTVHIQEIDKLLKSLVEHYGLDPEIDLPLRYKVAKQVQSCLCQKLPECSVTVYGSSCSSFGLKDSDLNLDLHVQKEADIPKSLVTAFEILQGSSEYKSVSDHFDAKFPRILFKHVKSGLSCELSAGFGAAPATSRLLKAYADIDPVVRQLVIAFRYWAKLCEVDRQGEGSLPAHSFALMVIQFLQHIDPPVLPRIELEKTSEALKEGKSIHLGAWKAEKKYSLGQLWIELFRYYCMSFKMEECVISVKEKQPLTREAKKWGMRRIAIEDPFVLKKNIASSMSSPRVFTYFMECLRSTLKYFCSIPEEALQNSNLSKRKSDSDMTGSTDSHSKCEAEPTRVMSSTSDSLKKHSVQQVREQVKHGEAKTEMSSQNNGGEDSESDSSATNSDEETILECGTDREGCTRNVGSVTEAVDTEVENVTKLKRVTGSVEAGQAASPECDDWIIFHMEDFEKTATNQTDKSDGSQDSVGIHNKVISRDAKMSKVTVEQGKRTEALASEMGKLSVAGDHTDAGRRKTDTDCKNDSVEANLQEFVVEHKPLEIIQSHVSRHLSTSFKFEMDILRGGGKHQVTCSYCKLDGHVKDSCPEKMREKIPLMRLPPVTMQFAALLERVCRACKVDFALNQSEVHHREKVLRKLEDYIRETYPGAKLHLFGSSKNGLGFHTSDLDICMTVDGKNKEDLDCIEVIRTLTRKLKKHKDCSNVLAITTAKVPIVKFFLRSCHREADISLYNTLALENTRLLALYCKFDERVKILGYTVKVFAKVCDIGDASKGSLSSYAYILLLLHFLQQREVVPVFQELYSGDTPPQNIVEGWNCWFYDDMSNLSKVWSPKIKNRKTAGELWLDFLNFYSEEFDFDWEVVCCRRKKRLTKFEKMWTKPVFAIEDPFNLDHNLGGGISRRMGNFILHAFQRARERFGMPWPQLYEFHPDLIQQYFFNPQFLNNGDIAPSDRNCRVCGKIGHIAKDCPLSKANRKAEKQREEQEEQEEHCEKVEERSRLSNKPFTNTPPPNDQLPRRWSVPVSPPRQVRPVQVAVPLAAVTAAQMRQAPPHLITSPSVDGPQGRPGPVEEQPCFVSRPIQQPPPPQRQLQFVQPCPPLLMSPPRQTGWPVPLYQVEEVEDEGRAAQASPNRQMLDRRNSDEYPRNGPGGNLEPQVCLPQTLEIQSQPMDTGGSKLPYPHFGQQSRDPIMSPRTPQTPALYYCTSPPGFVPQGRTRSMSDSGLIIDMQIQCQPQIMAGSAPLLFFPQSPPQAVFRNEAWSPLRGTAATVNQPGLPPQTLQSGVSSQVPNSPLQQSMGSPPLLSSVGNTPLLPVGSPPSPWQQPGLPQPQRVPPSQTVLGSRMTANQFFELIKKSEKEEEEKKREKRSQRDDTIKPPLSPTGDVKLDEIQGSPKQTWNEDQLTKMVKSDKVRALWGSKESGEKTTMYMKPSDDDMTYKEPRNPDDSSVAISGSNSSEMRLPENKNNPKQIASTGKGGSFIRAQAEAQSSPEASHFEKSEDQDTLTRATLRVEGTSNESVHGMNSGKEIKQGKKKKRTRKGGRNKGGSRTPINDLEEEEGQGMTQTHYGPNKVIDSVPGTTDGKKISGKGNPQLAEKSTRRSMQQIKDSASCTPDGMKIPGKGNPQLVEDSKGCSVQHVKDSASATPDGTKIPGKGTPQLVDKSKGGSIQQPSTFKDNLKNTKLEDRTQESKKVQQKGPSEEMKSNQKKKPSRQHANSWSERGSYNQKQRDLKKKATKVDESSSGDPKIDQAGSSQPGHIVRTTVPVDSSLPFAKGESRDYYHGNKGRGGRHRGTRGGRPRANIDDKATEDGGSSNRANSSRGRGAGQQRGGGGNRSARGGGRKESKGRSHSAPQSPQNTGSGGNQNSSNAQPASQV